VGSQSLRQPFQFHRQNLRKRGAMHLVSGVVDFFRAGHLRPAFVQIAAGVRIADRGEKHQPLERRLECRHRPLQ